MLSSSYYSVALKLCGFTIYVANNVKNNVPKPIDPKINPEISP